MSFDPFRPEDAGDFTASYEARHATRRRSAVLPRVLVAVGALALLAAAAIVAVAVV